MPTCSRACTGGPNSGCPRCAVAVAEAPSLTARPTVCLARCLAHTLTWCAVRCATLRRPLLMIAYHSLWDSAFIFLCPGVDLAFLVAPLPPLAGVLALALLVAALPRCLLCPLLVVLAVVVSTSSSRRRRGRSRHLVLLLLVLLLVLLLLLLLVLLHRRHAVERRIAAARHSVLVGAQMLHRQQQLVHHQEAPCASRESWHLFALL